LRSPDTLVSWVVDKLSSPFALVGRVLLHRRFPFATARGFLALGVGDRWWDPVTILLVIPILGLLGLRVRDSGRLILEPVFGLGSLLVNNLEWCILIPVLGLLGLWVCNTSLINPVFRLLIVGVVNLLIRVD
jgi:hypothetical protein